MMTQGGKPRRRWLVWLGGAAGLLVLTVVVIVVLLLRTPGWYQPIQPPSDPREKQAIRNTLTDAEQAFTHSLIQGKPFTYHIYDEHINQWLAMRYEIYPRIDEFVPPVVTDPFVRIGEGYIRFGGRREFRGVDAVVSVDILPTFAEGKLALRLGSVRCGSFSIPIDPAEFGIDGVIAMAPSDAWPGSPSIDGDFESGLRIGARGRWQNGGVEYEVTDIRTQPGQIDIDVRPLKR